MPWLKQQEQRTRAKAADLSDGALSVYRVHVRRIAERFGGVLLHKIEAMEVQDWLLAQAEHVGHRTQCARLWVLKAILDHARMRRMIEFNPLKQESVRVPGRAEKRVGIPDHSDMNVLRDFVVGKPGMPAPRPANHQIIVWSSMRVAIVLAAACGMRRGEICGLKWDRITREQERAEIYVKDVIEVVPRPRLKDRTKSPAGERKIPLTLEVQQVLNEHAKVYGEHFGTCVGHVIRNNTGAPFISPKTIGERFERIMLLAGLCNADGKPKFTFHALRHYAASWWVAN